MTHSIANSECAMEKDGMRISSSQLGASAHVDQPEPGYIMIRQVRPIPTDTTTSSDGTVQDPNTSSSNAITTAIPASDVAPPDSPQVISSMTNSFVSSASLGGPAHGHDPLSRDLTMSNIAYMNQASRGPVLWKAPFANIIPFPRDGVYRAPSTTHFTHDSSLADSWVYVGRGMREEEQLVGFAGEWMSEHPTGQGYPMTLDGDIAGCSA